MDRRNSEASSGLAATRDARLAMLSRTRSLVAVASITLVAVLGGLYALAKPGKSSGSSSGPAPARLPKAPSRLTQRPLVSGSTVAPATAPQPAAVPAAPAPPPPVAVSGGS